jgi:hypothetical protein
LVQPRLNNPGTHPLAHELPWDTISHAAAVFGLFGAVLRLFALESGPRHVNLDRGVEHAVGLQMMREWYRGGESPFWDFGGAYIQISPKITEEERRQVTMDLGKGAAPYEALLKLPLLPNRRLARTVRGYFCLFLTKNKIGGRVMIVAGCPILLVLRRGKQVED